MPKLHLKKVKTGCQRCKVRKVKCDEHKPQCLACARHHVECVYPKDVQSDQQSPISSSNIAESDPDYSTYQLQHDPSLELRLMHEWTACVCETFSSAWEFWKYQVPMTAQRYRHVMDALFALSALYDFRQGTRRWSSTHCRMVPVGSRSNANIIARSIDLDRKDEWKAISKARPQSPNDVKLDENFQAVEAKRRSHMLLVSRSYFDQAIDGHRKSIATLSPLCMEAATITSILVSYVALFTLDATGENQHHLDTDATQWYGLARATRTIVDKWAVLAGPDWVRRSGVFYGKPDMTDNDELFKPEHSKPFGKLLVWATDDEDVTGENVEAYQMALSYIGLAYKGIVERLDELLVTCRRLLGMPSRMPPRFSDLVEQQQPRALAILAHSFACMRLISEHVFWFEGIAERQIPDLYMRMPEIWKPMLEWPMSIAAGDIRAVPHQTQT